MSVLKKKILVEEIKNRIKNNKNYKIIQSNKNPSILYSNPLILNEFIKQEWYELKNMFSISYLAEIFCVSRFYIKQKLKLEGLRYTSKQGRKSKL